MNKISDKAFIGEGVVIGKNNVISPNVSIIGNTVIGDNNYFAPGVTIGFPSRQIVKPRKWEKNKVLNPNNKVVIGSNCSFFEYLSIHPSLSAVTLIEDNVSIGSSSHIGHDCHIKRDAILSSNVSLAGYTIISEYANIGLGVSFHQRSVVGAYSMVGMNCACKGYVYPFSVVVGVPASFLKINYIGLKRNGFSEDLIKSIENHVLLNFKLIDSFKKVVQDFEVDCQKYKNKKLNLRVIRNEL
ncbi:hypothetical protein [Kordia sp.]|uniref:hypothetical protein n=1 Tax=Kordia sp. TaxID=1965332 RepID=UPI003D2E6BC2